MLEWLLGDRHEAEELLAKRGVARVMQDFHSRDLEQVRKLLATGPAARAALLGSFVSDLWLYNAGKTPDGDCSFCGAAQGCFWHAVWECPFTIRERPRTPTNSL